MALFGMMVIALLVYARFYPSNYQHEPVTVIYPERSHSVLSDTTKSKSSNSVPPSGHLISTDSGRHSSYQPRVHYTGSVV
nr:expressed protein [Hymenolepis microstoma]